MSDVDSDSSSILHVVDGEMTAGRLRQSGVPGSILSWSEAVIEGPAPGGVSLDEWNAIRADFQSGSAEVPFDEVIRSLEAMQASLIRHTDEVVLWFGEELFCQLNLASVLSRIGDEAGRRVSIVNLGRDPHGRAIHGSELEVTRLLAHHAARSTLDPLRRRELGDFWNAFTTNDPSTLVELSEEPTSRRSSLAHSHLTRFPSVRNGLGVVEEALLVMIASGVDRFSTIFRTYSERNPSWGFGDLQIWNHLNRLARGPNPLLTIRGTIPDAVLTILPEGSSVLTGESDLIELNGIDLWLGGVHLTSTTDIWRWDGESSTLIAEKRGL